MRLGRIVVSAGVAIGVFVVVNEIGLYKRHGGPILLTLGPDGANHAIHAGDLVVLGVSFAGALWATRRLAVRFAGSR